ncbi:MAG: glycoside hydrolase family 16 protein [Calditrichia bacterium]
MKSWFSIVKILVLSVFVLTFTPQCSKKSTNNDSNEKSPYEIPGWTLVWHDEFGGNKVDSGKWEYEVNADGGGNNELQYYTARSENSFVRDGSLHIVALKEHYTGPDGTREYTSARLRTKGKGDWKYGRFDIRAKLPYGQGLWPAIWMLPTDWVYGGWAASGEIDIMELLGHETDKVYGTLHYGGNWPDNVHTGDSYTLPQGSFAQNFHLFTLEWDTTEFRWYVDGNHYLTQNQWYSSAADYPAPFDQPFHLLLNVAVGGDWPGSPNLSTTFPQEMLVDYVRVYRKQQ